jgi:hypothetical protein
MDSIKGIQHITAVAEFTEMVYISLDTGSIKSIQLNWAWYIAKEDGKDGNMRGCTKLVPNISWKQGASGSSYIQMQSNKQNHWLYIPKEIH